MLVDGVLSHGHMSYPYLCSARDARGCSWMGCPLMGPRAILHAARRMLVEARGWGAPSWAHEQFLPVRRTGCSRVGCSHMGP